MGAHHKEESRVEDDGLWAALYGVNKIASGSADVGLIIAYSKPSESDVSKFYSTLADPFCQRPVGLNDVTASGLLARLYAQEHGVGEVAFAKVAAKAWERARENPNVSTEAAPSVDEIMASPEVASPLRQLMMARPLDGAVAIILASEKFARRVTPTPVWVTGMGAAMDGNVFAMRSNTLDACAAAARMAYTKAGVKPASFGFAELSATSAVTELMTVEALGLAEPGRGLAAYLGAGIPINPSGGALPANPIMATGLVRLAEAAERLWATGGGGGSALVHASSGLGAQSHCVFVVEV
jgi:acetyl-CoA C-acetyltransferase